MNAVIFFFFSPHEGHKFPLGWTLHFLIWSFCMGTQLTFSDSLPGSFKYFTAVILKPYCSIAVSVFSLSARKNFTWLHVYIRSCCVRSFTSHTVRHWQILTLRSANHVFSTDTHVLRSKESSRRYRPSHQESLTASRVMNLLTSDPPRLMWLNLWPAAVCLSVPVCLHVCLADFTLTLSL